MNNIGPLAKQMQKSIQQFLTIEVPVDATEEERVMFQSLRKAVDNIDKYIATQPMENRKFEVGKSYYRDDYKLMRVDKITDKGVWFEGAYGASRRNIDSGNNEYVSGAYNVKA